MGARFEIQKLYGFMQMPCFMKYNAAHYGERHCLLQDAVTANPYWCLEEEHLYGPQFSVCRGNAHERVMVVAC